MVTALLCLTVLAGSGPRLDGRYVTEGVAKAIREETFGELEISSGASFGRKKVQLDLGLEAEQRPWTWKAGVLTVGEREVSWVVGADGVVESDLLGASERLVFLEKVTTASLRARLAANLRSRFVAQASGTWRGAGNVLVATKQALTWNGKPLRPLACAVSCGDEPTVCLDVGKRLLAPRGGKVVEVRVEGLCVGTRTGVEVVDGGVVLERAPE